MASRSRPGTSLDRRDLLKLFGAAGLSPALAACVGPGTRTGSSGGSDLHGPVQGNVSFAHWRAEDQSIFTQLIGDFQAKTANVTVRQDISPSNDYQSTGLQKVLKSDVGDVFVSFPGAQFYNMIDAGVYTDVSGESLVHRYEPTLISGGSNGNKQYGLPYQYVFNMPVVNTDLLGKAGIGEHPMDWNGFLAMCDALKSKGVVPLAWPGADLGNTGHFLGSMVMNNAPEDDMFARVETGRLKLTDDWFLTTLRQYAQLRPYFQPNATGTAVEPAQQLFAQQQAAMLATGSFHITAFRKLGGNFPIDLLSPITVPADQMKHEGIHNATFILGVNHASSKKAAALAFVEYLSDPAVAGRYANATKQHVTVAGVQYTDPDLHALEPWLRRKTLLSPVYQFKNLDIQKAVETAAVQVVGGTSPEQAAETAQHIADQKK
jgi:raffinose/stachyose/melibiose transport system substrate-binding protein